MSKTKFRPPPFRRNPFFVALLLMFASCSAPEGPTIIVPVSILINFPNKESPSSFSPAFILDSVVVTVDRMVQNVVVKDNLFIGRFTIPIDRKVPISVAGYVNGRILFVSTSPDQEFVVTEHGEDLSIDVAYRPFVRSVLPSEGNASFSPSKEIRISFSAAVDRGSIDSTSVILREANGPPVPGIFIFLDSSNVEFKPSNPLSSSQSFDLFVSDDVKDKQGRQLVRYHKTHFSTK